MTVFIATSYARTKLNKETQTGIWDDYATLLLTINPELEESELYKTVEDLKAQPMPYFFYHFLRIVLPYLMTMNISIISITEDQGFITSDNPVIWIDPTVFIPGEPISFFGVKSPLLNIMMPIAPKMIAILSREYVNGYGTITQSGYSDEVNAMMVTFCDKWLVNSSDQVNDYWFRGVDGRP